MNEEKAILHFNKFKAIRNQTVLDNLTGLVYQVVKVRKIRHGADDFSVMIEVRNQLSDTLHTFDSEYANSNFREERNL